MEGNINVYVNETGTWRIITELTARRLLVNQWSRVRHQPAGDRIF